MTFLGYPTSSAVKNLPAVQETQEMQETQVWYLGQKDHLEGKKGNPLSFREPCPLLWECPYLPQNTGLGHLSAARFVPCYLLLLILIDWTISVAWCNLGQSHSSTHIWNWNRVTVSQAWHAAGDLSCKYQQLWRECKSYPAARKKKKIKWLETSRHKRE